MPEGPECTRVARQLNRAVANKSLVSVNLLTGRYAKKTPVGFEEFVGTLPDTVTTIDGMRAKLISTTFGSFASSGSSDSTSDIFERMSANVFSLSILMSNSKITAP